MHDATDSLGPAATYLDSGAGVIQPTPEATRLDDDAPGTPAATTLDAAASFIPTVLPPGMASRYRLVRALGGGGEAVVYLAERLHDSEGVAVKVFRQDFVPSYVYPLESSEHVKAFPPEHAVRIFERVEEFGHHYEIMEYCPHGTLGELLASDDWDEALLPAVVSEVSRALSAMYPTVHGDIKPSNILIRTMVPLDLVLTDFGLTKDLQGRSHVTNVGKGSLAYLAPEATIALRPESDWWALGMTLAELAMRRHPYQVSSVARDGIERWLSENTIREQLSTRPVPVDDVEDADLRKLVRGLLVRDPMLRWGSREVAAWIAGKSPELPEETESPSLPTRSKQIGFGFAGKLYNHPAALGDAMQANEHLTEELIEEVLRFNEFRQWLGGDDASDAVTRIAAAKSLPNRLRGALMGAALASEHRPMLRGFDLSDPSQILSMAEDDALLPLLYSNRVMHHFGTILGIEALVKLDHQWRFLVAEVEKLLPPSVLADQSTRMLAQRAALAIAMGGDEALTKQHKILLAQKRRTPGVTELDWFKAVPNNREPASVVARLAALPVARTQLTERRADEEEQRQQGLANARALRASRLDTLRLAKRGGNRGGLGSAIRQALRNAAGMWLGIGALTYLFWILGIPLIAKATKTEAEVLPYLEHLGRALGLNHWESFPESAPIMFSASGMATVVIGTLLLAPIKHRLGRGTAGWTVLGCFLLMVIATNPVALVGGAWSPLDTLMDEFRWLVALPLITGLVGDIRAPDTRRRREEITRAQRELDEVERQIRELEAKGPKS